MEIQINFGYFTPAQLMFYGIGIIVVVAGAYWKLTANRQAQRQRDQQRRFIEAGWLDETPEVKHKRQTRQKHIFGALGVGLLIGGLFVLAVGLLETRKVQANGEWPTVTARVESAEIRYVSSGRNSHYYAIFGVYSYQVNGNHHERELQIIRGSPDELRQQVTTYPGSQATLWYDPARPLVASLTRIGIELALVIIGVSAVLLLVSIGFLYYALKPL